MCFFHGREGFNGLSVEYNGWFSIPINNKPEEDSCSLSKKHSH